MLPLGFKPNLVISSDNVTVQPEVRYVSQKLEPLRAQIADLRFLFRSPLGIQTSDTRLQIAGMQLRRVREVDQELQVLLRYLVLQLGRLHEGFLQLALPRLTGHLR